jgi:uncharacterized protein YdhG (YjbR/CyaY superfamily)
VPWLPSLTEPVTSKPARPATATGDRTAHFPAIEARSGRSVGHWLAELAALGDVGYDGQVAFLREGHGFSRTHANALVMYARGSATSKRYDTPEAFFAALDEPKRATARAIFAAISGVFPDLELVIAWNQPMLRRGKDYVFGLSAARNHLTLAAMGSGAIEALEHRLGGLETNKKTIRVPVDWVVDGDLLVELVRLRLSEIPGPGRR